MVASSWTARGLVTVLIATLWLSGCVYGPKTEKKSPLNYLSGEHYESSREVPSAVIIPILKRKPVPTKIKGQVVLELKPAPILLRFQTLRLLQNNKELMVTQSGPDGQFEFHGMILNGHYKIILDTEKFTGSVAVDVDSYLEDNITLIALSKKP